MSGSGWVEAFLEMMSVERASAKNTLTAYGKDLADAQAFLASRSNGLAQASAEDVEAYFNALSDRGLSPATAAHTSIPPAAQAPDKYPASLRAPDITMSYGGKHQH